MFCIRKAIYKSAILAWFLTVALTCEWITCLWEKDVSSQPQFAEGFHKGICYVAWERDRYLSRFSDGSMDRLANTGADWVSIVVTWYMEDPFSYTIAPSMNTPSDESVRHVIKKAHALGLKVMLKPHVDLIHDTTGYWRGDICQNNEEDWNRWFQCYTRFIATYAKLANENDVDMFCVGTELASTTDRRDAWKEVIGAVRSVYKGPLTYAAHWDGEFQQVAFWDELDYVGIDAYFPLSDEKKPTIDDIKAGWKQWIDLIEGWIAAVQKPVIFVEIGYASSSGAARFPWEECMPGSVDLSVQKDCYQAFFEEVSHRDWCKGVYWWRWNTNARSGGFCNKGFTPQNKPAEKVLAEWYRRHAPDISGQKSGLSVVLNKNTSRIEVR